MRSASEEEEKSNKSRSPTKKKMNSNKAPERKKPLLFVLTVHLRNVKIDEQKRIVG
jgi:hypothetical protein